MIDDSRLNPVLTDRALEAGRRGSTLSAGSGIGFRHGAHTTAAKVSVSRISHRVDPELDEARGLSRRRRHQRSGRG
jgi:hypothetical protein